VKVYVITRGIYSDYHIITATTDEALASKIAEKYSIGLHDPDDRPQVEVYENAEETLLPYWDITFNASGEVAKIKCIEQPTIINSDFYVRWDGSAYGGVFAPNCEAAIKIAAEKRAKALAEKQGL
jgi:hypothetical protein